nr:polyadenylate-binding protein 2 [Hydra vulgaris]
MTGEHTSVIYGTHYPNRLFVGCLPPDAGAEDLGTFFANYGNVVEAKVVLDKFGVSKRFGFVTFSNAEDVETLINGKDVIFQGKKINVGPAVKKNVENMENNNNQSAGHENSQNKDLEPPQSIQQIQPIHVAKTIIRKSPLETCQRLNYEQDESSFQSIWGISNQKVSVWGPLSNSFSQYTSKLTEKPSSILDQTNKKPAYYQRYFKNSKYTPTFSNGLRDGTFIHSLSINK